MADLLSGRYMQQNPLWAALGLASNTAQGNLPVYTNASFLGLGGLTDNTTAVTTAKANAVAVPVDVGAVITKVSIFVGSVAQATSTQGNFALYSGGLAVPTLIGAQTVNDVSASGGTTVSTVLTKSFPTPILITQAMAPQGYIYVSYGFTATTAPSLASVPVAAAAAYQWSALSSVTAAPLGFAFNTTGGGAAAPATLAATVTVAGGCWLAFLQ